MARNYFFFSCCAITLLILYSCVERTTILDTDSFAVQDTSIISKIFLSDRKGNEITLLKIENELHVENEFLAREQSINTLLETINRIRIKKPVSINHLDHIINDIITTGIKVEIYDANKLIKVYTVGNETSDQLGTYMILQNIKDQKVISEPYVLHIPGFNGYLSPRYGIQAQYLNKKNWRSRKIFNSLNIIENISIFHIKNPDFSFSLTFHPTNLFDFSGNSVDFNINSVNKFISFFSDLQCESFKDSININEYNYLVI